MSPTRLKSGIGLGNPRAQSPTPLGLIQTHIFRSKPARIDKQTVIATNNYESDPIKKLHWAWEPAGTVPDAAQATPASFLLVKTFRN